LGGPGIPGASRSFCDVLKSKTKEKEKEIRKKKKNNSNNKGSRKEEDRKIVYTTSRDEDSYWKNVEKRRKRNVTKRRKQEKADKDKDKEKSDKKDRGMRKDKGNDALHSSLPTEKSAIQLLQKKIPKTCAVVIKGKTDNFSYADALTKLRNSIPLKEIGISNTKVKKTASGAVLIEVPGANSKGVAEELRRRAADVLGEMATVTRPETLGEIRVVGFDESVNASDIITGIAKTGGCGGPEVKVTPITPMRNGLYMTRVKCPLAAAIKASKVGKVSLGWTVARLELQKPSTPRCFRCWYPGHHQSACISEVDRSHTCFRCGEKDHKAIRCTNEAKCALCASEGLPSRHRMGSFRCGATGIHKSTVGSEAGFPFKIYK